MARRHTWPRLLTVIVAALAGGCDRRAFLERETPHEAYASALERAGLHESALGRDWIRAAEQALNAPTAVSLPVETTLVFEPGIARAFAFRFDMKRGRVLHVAVQQAVEPRALVFIDLFRVGAGGPAAAPDHVAAAPRDRSTIQHEARRDGTFILRLQPELLRGGTLKVTQHSSAALHFPVSGRDASAVQSFFLDPRDGGQREHHGVDIFAPTGTPVVAAADGVVTSVATTPRGGNVVWIWDTKRNQSQYYAHLSSQAVSAGRRVSAGEVIGHVGNTGNARTTAPHLHFGIYALGEGPIDPFPFVRPAEQIRRTTGRGSPDTAGTARPTRKDGTSRTRTPDRSG